MKSLSICIGGPLHDRPANHLQVPLDEFVVPGVRYLEEGGLEEFQTLYRRDARAPAGWVMYVDAALPVDQTDALVASFLRRQGA